MTIQAEANNPQSRRDFLKNSVRAATTGGIPFWFATGASDLASIALLADEEGDGPRSFAFLGA